MYNKVSAYHFVKLCAFFFLIYFPVCVNSREMTGPNPLKTTFLQENSEDVLLTRSVRSNSRKHFLFNLRGPRSSLATDFNPFVGTGCASKKIDYFYPTTVLALPLPLYGEPNPALSAKIIVPPDYRKDGSWVIRINGLTQIDSSHKSKNSVVCFEVSAEISRKGKTLSNIYPYSNFLGTKSLKIEGDRCSDSLTQFTFNIPGLPRLLKKGDILYLKILRKRSSVLKNHKNDFFVQGIEFVYNKKKRSKTKIQPQESERATTNLYAYYLSGETEYPIATNYTLSDDRTTTTWGYVITPGNYGDDEESIPEENGVYSTQGLNYIVGSISENYPCGSSSIPLAIFGNILTSGGNGGTVQGGNPVSAPGGGGAAGYFISYQITPNFEVSPLNPFIVSLGIGLADTVTTYNNGISDLQQPCSLHVGIGNIQTSDNDFSNLTETITLSIPGGDAGTPGNGVGDYWSVANLNGGQGGGQGPAGAGGDYLWNSTSSPTYTFTINQASYTLTYTYINPVASDTSSSSTCLSAYGGTTLPSSMCNGINGNTPFSSGFTSPIFSTTSSSQLKVCGGGGAGGTIELDGDTVIGETLPGYGVGLSPSLGGSGGFPYLFPYNPNPSQGVLGYNALIAQQGVPPVTLALGSGGGGNGATDQGQDVPSTAGFGSAGFATVYLFPATACND